MSTPDNPQAFPEILTASPDERMGRYHPETYSRGGMTLRDYFAGQALAGIASGNMRGTTDELAHTAYSLADSMLAARSEAAP